MGAFPQPTTPDTRPAPPHLRHSKIEHDRFIHGNVPLDTFWLASFNLGVF